MNEERVARSNVTSMGRTLLAEGLVARTWGNISERIGEKEFLITPSGLAYTETKDEDLAVYNLETDEWRGPYKPSGERAVHAIAYRQFPEANFVIHTHQRYATAFGVAGFDSLVITEEEKEKLGGLAVAEYGLPGQKKLQNAVASAMATGAHTIIMKYHGVVVAGSDVDEAFARVKLLEEICERNYKGADIAAEDPAAGEALLSKVKMQFPLAQEVATPAVCGWAALGEPLRAQLDDMAQMIGGVIPVAKNDPAAVTAALSKTAAVFVPGIGAIVNGKDEDDTQALGILVDKAAISALWAKACGVKVKMGFFDVQLQNLIYKKKYSKQKGSK